MSTFGNLLGRSRGGLTKALLLSTAMSALGGAEAFAAQADAPTATGLSEVVVTARRRDEDLQSTPVSVTALSGSAAQELNLQTFQDLRGIVPNLEVLPLNSGGANLTIRGVGQGSTQVNVDVKTGLYVDEMYVARQEGNSLYFYDVDSLQVLKGPQGTLFGKNTTAGAFVLNSVRPGPEQGGYVRLRAGNYSRFDTEGGINLPISDTVLTRFSWRTQNADGYIKHVLDDETNNNDNDKAARLQVRFLPSSQLTVDLLGEYARSNTNGTASIYANCLPTAAYQRNFTAAHGVSMCDIYKPLGRGGDLDYTVYGGATLSIPTSTAITPLFAGGDYRAGNTNARQPGVGAHNDTEVSTVNLRINYDLTDNLSFKSITALRRSSANWYNPTINAPHDIYAEYDETATTQWTQEFNLSGVGLNARLNYVFGLYFYDQNTHFLQDTGPDWIDPVGYTYAATNRFKSWAAYAQASFKIIEPLEITLGGRYNKDKKDANSSVFLQTNFAAPCNGFVNAFRSGAARCGGFLTGVEDQTWSSFDPRGQISFQVTPSFFVYASATKGYNSGGFNQQVGSNVARGSLISYDPEKLLSYEAGFKSEWWDRRVRLNATAFTQDYKDIQTTVTVTFNGVTTRQVQTGATAREQGLEGELELLLTENLMLRGNLAYLTQKYTSVRPGATFTIDTPVTTAPKWTYAVSGNYTWDLASGGEVQASLNWRGVGSKPSCNPVGSCENPAYGLLGGRLDWTPADGYWTVGLWATNLLDAYYRINQNTTPGGMGIGTYTPGTPRQFGVEVRRLF